MTAPLRIGFVPGVTPDKWARIWRERLPGDPLELVPLAEGDDPRALVDEGSLDMCFLRLPIDRNGLHVIPLYDEVPVVVADKEHPVAAFDEVDLADLAAEQLVLGDVPDWEQIRTTAPLDFPEMDTREAIEVVASGTGIVIVPMSLARLHHRKDVIHRPVRGVPETKVGLAWLVTNEDPRLETFIGIVRGRSANSTRGREQPAKPAKAPKPARSAKPSKPAGQRSGAKPRGKGRAARGGRRPR